MKKRAITAVSASKQPSRAAKNISIEIMYKNPTTLCEWIYTGAEPAQQDGKSG
jgi:hypothetical protein